MATIDFNAIVIDAILNNTRHLWYDRVVEEAELYTKLSTGENAESLLRQFVLREDDKLFEQRKRLTQQITSAIINELSASNYKIPRSPGLTKVYEYKESEENQKELTAKLEGFYGIMSWDDYLESRVLELNDTDPNAWIVIESNSTDGTTRVDPYPFEVSSKEAINFEINNNILQWLLVRNDITFKVEDKDKEGHKFTVYHKTGWVKFVEINPKSVTILEEKVIVNTELGQAIKLNDHVYIITTGNYKTDDKVPAFRAGFTRDKYTKGLTFIPSWGAAIPYLMKTVKANSEMDLASALHIFLQKIAYQKECQKCQGRCYIDGGEEGRIECPKCGGVGYDIANTTQDAITFGLPSTTNPNDLIDLDNLVKYVGIDTTIPEFQKGYIDDLIIKCKQAVFNAAVMNKEDVNKTATGVGVNREKEYDVLWPLANTHVKVWRFGVNVIANMTALQKDLEIITNVSKDLKLKTKTDYMNDLQIATTAGASQSIQNNIEQEIIRIDFEDNPLMLNKHMTQDFFFPFSGKNDTEVATIISLLPPTDSSRVLWMYYGVIFNEIELDIGARDFYIMMDRKTQKKIIDGKVDEKIAELEANKPQLNIDD